jgi:hypothetical protein
MLLRQRGRHPLQPLLARCGLYPLIRLMMRLAGINWHFHDEGAEAGRRQGDCSQLPPAARGSIMKFQNK